MPRSKARTYIGALLIAADLLAIAPTRAETRVKLAVFDFELEDFSAGANVTVGSEEDNAQLQRVTNEVRRLVAGGGRYELVDVGQVKDRAILDHQLQQCGGCDAAIAGQLGADQSMTGIVSRISRTEYQISYIIREAASGKILSSKQTDLRIGADYSWYRGAASLINGMQLR